METKGTKRNTAAVEKHCNPLNMLLSAERKKNVQYQGHVKREELGIVEAQISHLKKKEKRSKAEVCVDHHLHMQVKAYGEMCGYHLLRWAGLCFLHGRHSSSLCSLYNIRPFISSFLFPFPTRPLLFPLQKKGEKRESSTERNSSLSLLVFPLLLSLLPLLLVPFPPDSPSVPVPRSPSIPVPGSPSFPVPVLLSSPPPPYSPPLSSLQPPASPPPSPAASAPGPAPG